jgi:transcriptional regulator with XRE-family HTH domain
VSDNELGVFLRTCREAVTPAEVGLPTGDRRRTPGLRRAELATLAGVSVEYLTRLEQGRDRHPSVQVLGALADALRLSGAARIHLRNLVKATSGAIGLCPAATAPPARSVRPTVQALLDRIEPAPAVLLNRLSDILACTSGYQRLAGPIGILSTQPANLARFVFTDARARAAYPDWDRVAGDLIASLKTESVHTDPHTEHLVNELTITAGALFTERWSAPPVLPPRTGVERLLHPDVGELRLAYETLQLPDNDYQRLVIYLPADDATAVALDRLARPDLGTLRAVRG